MSSLKQVASKAKTAFARMPAFFTKVRDLFFAIFTTFKTKLVSLFPYWTKRLEGQHDSTGLSLHKRPKFAKFIQITVVFTASFAFAFLCGSLSFIPKHSQAADDYGDGTGGTIAFSIDQTSLNLDISNNALGQLVTGEINMNVKTDNLTGYNLTMQAKDPDNINLTHTNSTDYIPSTTNNTASTLAMNTWGYNKTSLASDGSSISYPLDYPADATGTLALVPLTYLALLALSKSLLAKLFSTLALAQLTQAQEPVLS